MTKVGFAPTMNRLLIELEPETPLSSVIEVQKHTEGLCRWGRVVAIGPEVRDTKVGQRVLASILAGVELPHGMLLSEDSVLAFAHESHE